MNRDKRGSQGISLRSEWKKKLFTLFISIMGAKPIDIFESEGKVSLLIEKEDFYRIKRAGLHKLKLISRRVGKEIEIVVFSQDLEECAKNLFRPAKVNNIEREQRGEKELLKVYVQPWEKGKALGRKSYKLHRARAFLKRYFNIDNVRIV